VYNSTNEVYFSATAIGQAIVGIVAVNAGLRQTRSPHQRKEHPMHELHPVEKSPPYHVAIWIVAGLIAAAIIFGYARRADNPPAPPAEQPATQEAK
jgi:hypothetical protein